MTLVKKYGMEPVKINGYDYAVHRVRTVGDLRELVADPHLADDTRICVDMPGMDTPVYELEVSVAWNWFGANRLDAGQRTWEAEGGGVVLVEAAVDSQGRIYEFSPVYPDNPATDIPAYMRDSARVWNTACA